MGLSKKLLRILYESQLSIVEKFKSGYSKYVLDEFLAAYRKYNDTYLSVRNMPQNASEEYYIELESDKCVNDIAIVLQGAVLNVDDFTLETCKLYKKNFPECILILSTWEGDKIAKEQEYLELGVVIVKSTKPKHTGIGNINLQVKSTNAGILKAKELGAKYVLKCRSDQRFYRNNFLQYLLSQISLYPIIDANNVLQQNERLVVLQSVVGASLFIPFHICDFMYFGKIDDVQRLFNFPEQNLSETKEERTEREKSFLGNISILDFHRRQAPEIMLMENYLQGKIEGENILSISNYWSFLRDYVVVVSQDSMGFLWGKEGRYNSLNSIDHCWDKNDSEDKLMKYTLNEVNWFLLLSGGIKYHESYEEFSKRIIT